MCSPNTHPQIWASIPLEGPWFSSRFEALRKWTNSSPRKKGGPFQEKKGFSSKHPVLRIVFFLWKVQKEASGTCSITLEIIYVCYSYIPTWIVCKWSVHVYHQFCRCLLQEDPTRGIHFLFFEVWHKTWWSGVITQLGTGACSCFVVFESILYRSTHIDVTERTEKPPEKVTRAVKGKGKCMWNTPSPIIMVQWKATLI